MSSLLTGQSATGSASAAASGDQGAAAGNDPSKTATGAAGGEAAKADPAPAKIDEGKPGEGAKADAGKADEDKTKIEAPETYAEFKLPNGAKLEGARLDSFTSLAKEAKLPQDAAQKFVELYSKLQSEDAARLEDAQQAIRDGWATKFSEDKEFGGQKQGETVERVKRTIKRFGGDEGAKAIEQLDSRGYVDFDTLVRILARVDKTTGEDRVEDGGPSTDKRSAADIIYG